MNNSKYAHLFVLGCRIFNLRLLCRNLSNFHFSIIQYTLPVVALALNADLTLTFFTGGVILAADYSQLELRVIAHLSGDRKLISILNNDGDVFKMIAAQWKNTLPEAVTTEERQHAKQVCVDCPQQHNHQVFNSQLISAYENTSIYKNNFLNDDKYFWTCFAVHLFSSQEYAQFQGFWWCIHT